MHLIHRFIRLRKSIHMTGRFLFPNVLEIDADDYLDDIDWQPDSPYDYCPSCGHPIGPHEALAHGCSSCFKKKHPWHRLVRLGPYEAPLDRQIKALKYKRHWKWADHFGSHMACSIPQMSPQYPTLITDVPLHRNRLIQRGYNQSTLLAKRVARLRHMKYRPLLKRTVNTAPQSSLPPSKRASNVSGAFELLHPNLDLTDTQIILIDDIKTSGSTLKQCARLLKQANALTITVAVIAAAAPESFKDADEYDIKQTIDYALNKKS